MSAPSREVLEEEPLVESSQQQSRQTQGSPWSFNLATLFARLADAASATESRVERRDRSGQTSTSGRGEQGPPADLARAAPDSLASRSLGGILRQLSGRREVVDSARNDGETTAAAAERHRLTGTTTAIDLQALTSWSEKNAPFIFILFCVFVSKHAVGLSLFASMTAVIAVANDFIRKQIALKDNKRVYRILACMAALALLVPGPFVVPHSCLSWRTLLLMLPASVESVWDCLYCVTLADGAIRIASAVIKMAMLATCTAAPDDNFRRRSQLLTLVEHVSLLYRALVPTPLWFVYLYKSRGVMSSIFTGAFLATKCQFVYERASNVVASLKSVWRREAQYGKYLTPEELLEAGNSCAICQEPMTRPFQLTQCRHVFCDACLNEWLERQSTCPMCRAVVRPPGMQAFGNGAVSLLPQLF